MAGADNFDWEDVAAFDDHLYVGDIGDNAAQRSEIVVYRVPARSRAGAVTAERIPLRYSDRAQDAEALLVDPTNGALVVVTKRLDGTARVYAAEGGVLRGAGVVKLGNALQVTAGSVSGDGRTVVLRTYDRLLVWTRRRGESLPELFRRRPCTGRADLLREGQGESVALTRDGRAVYTVPEGLRPPLRRWAPYPGTMSTGVAAGHPSRLPSAEIPAWRPLGAEPRLRAVGDQPGDAPATRCPPARARCARAARARSPRRRSRRRACRRGRAPGRGRRRSPLEVARLELRHVVRGGAGERAPADRVADLGEARAPQAAGHAPRARPGERRPRRRAARAARWGRATPRRRCGGSGGRRGTAGPGRARGRSASARARARSGSRSR